MYRKCNYNLLEKCVAINNLFIKLQDKFETKVKIDVFADWKVPEYNPNSSIGKQIQYFRRKQHIRQVDLANKLNCDRGVIFNIENKEYKLVNINLLKNILKELDIENKININDEYIKFLMNNPKDTIKNIRENKKMTRQQFADFLGIQMSVIKNWEIGKAQPTRKSFEKIKKCMGYF